jgi:nucleoside-diphosphate-sugar epimerase
LQTRDFVFIDDAVRTTLAATFEPNVGGRCVNVASGQMVTVRELLEMLCLLTESRTVPIVLPARAGDIRQALGDTSLAQALFGTTPRVPLFEGLRRTVQYYRQAVVHLADVPRVRPADAERADVRC